MQKTIELNAFSYESEPGWIRTIDPYIKSVLLYQLSYEPLAFTDENFEGDLCTKTSPCRQCESAPSPRPEPK